MENYFLFKVCVFFLILKKTSTIVMHIVVSMKITVIWIFHFTIYNYRMTRFSNDIYTYLFAVCADRKFTNFDGRIYKIIEMKQIFVYRAHTQTAHNKNSKSNFAHTHIPYFTRSSIIQQSFLFRFSLCFCFCFFHCPFVRRAFIQGLDFYSYE